MANTYSNLNDLFTAIANAIRLKNGSADKIIADTFPTEIRNLNTGFDYVNHEVTEIKDYQFKNCTDLKSVDCYNLTSIGTGAFEGCSELETIVIYDNVVNVGENAFKGCTNTTIYCMFDSQPDSWNINWNIDGCELIYMSPVETWDISATENDNVIAKLYNDVNNDGYYRLVIGGSGNMKNWDSIIAPDHDPTYSPWKSYVSEILSLIIIDNVTNIGHEAFDNCTSLKSINIPDSVTSIGDDAFDNCTSLKSINIPDSVTSIGYYAFDNCTSLKSINIPDSVTSIVNGVFRGCTSLTSITIPDSVTSIGSYAFRNCTSLIFINMSDNVVHIGDQAFHNTAYYNNESNWKNDILYIDNCLITAKTNINGDYTIKDGATVIANFAFENCTSLTSIIIPNSVTVIGNYTFRYCESLTNVTLGNSVTSIGDSTFSYCESLTSINIPNSVTSIGQSVFNRCISLTSVTIPDSITSIGYYAFDNCTSLTSINYTGTISQWNSITFGTNWNYKTPNYTIYCTDGTIAKDGTITYYDAGGES